MDEVGIGATGILDLLVAITEGGHDDGTVGEEGISSMRPVNHASDAGRNGTVGVEAISCDFVEAGLGAIKRCG